MYSKCAIGIKGRCLLVKKERRAIYNFELLSFDSLSLLLLYFKLGLSFTRINNGMDFLLSFSFIKITSSQSPSTSTCCCHQLQRNHAYFCQLSHFYFSTSSCSSPTKCSSGRMPIDHGQRPSGTSNGGSSTNGGLLHQRITWWHSRMDGI